MTRMLVCCVSVLCGSVVAQSAEPPRMITFTVTIATWKEARLAKPDDPAAVAAAVAEMEKTGALSHLTRLKFSTLENQQAQFQFGESVSVVTGRNFGGFGGRGNVPGAGGPPSVATFQREQTGTIVNATARVVESGVLAELMIEQTRFDQSKPAAEDPTSAPPSKPTLSIRATATIPREAPLILGAFDTTTEGKSETTAVLVTAAASSPPQAAAAVDRPIIQVFSLQHVDGGALRKTLDELFPQRDFETAVDERSNTLLVKAGPETLDTIAAIILRLDEAPARKDEVR